MIEQLNKKYENELKQMRLVHVCEKVKDYFKNYGLDIKVENRDFDSKTFEVHFKDSKSLLEKVDLGNTLIVDGIKEIKYFSNKESVVEKVDVLESKENKIYLKIEVR